MGGRLRRLAVMLAVVVPLPLAGCAGSGRQDVADAGPPPPEAHTAPWRPAAPVEAGTTVLSLWAREIGCANGAPATGRIPPPAVEYGPDTIVIKVRIEPLAAADCPDNPETPLTVALREPVNGRTLLDGGFDPPRVPPGTTLQPHPFPNN
ncbi:hypothetical protein [Polymorphospora rubra]|uniref:hypothetical protein n=1 Tax=Polymorphospora rubra TaxID=338584 RepID=UPI0033C01447